MYSFIVVVVVVVGNRGINNKFGEGNSCGYGWGVSGSGGCVSGVSGSVSGVSGERWMYRLC